MGDLGLRRDFSVGPRQPPTEYRRSLPTVEQPAREINHLPPWAPRFRMPGAIPLLLLSACIAWTGKTLLIKQRKRKQS